MFDRRNNAKRLLFGGLALGMGAALWLAVVEVVFLAATGGRASIPAQGLLGTGMLLLLAGPILGLILGLISAGVHLAATHIADLRRLEPIWKARLYTALSVPLLAYIAQRLLAHPAVSRLSSATWLILGGGIVALAGIYFGSRVVIWGAARLAVGHAGRTLRLVAGPALLLVSVGLYLSDQILDARRLSLVHWVVAALTFFASWLGVGAVHFAGDRRARRWIGHVARPTRAGLLAAAVLIVGSLGGRLLTDSPRLRAEVVKRARLAGKVLDLTGRLGLLAPSAEPPRQAKRRAAPRRPRRSREKLRSADVVLITIHRWRADRLGKGTVASVTPEIDTRFSSAVRFTRAYSQTPLSSYAIVSLLTGQPTYTLARRGILQYAPALPKILASRRDYVTAGFYPDALFRVDRADLARYRSNAFGLQRFSRGSGPASAADRTGEALAFLEAHHKRTPKRPLFLWVHYDDLATSQAIPDRFSRGTGHTARYEATLSYVDHHVGRLLAGVAKHGRRTLTILTSDHGSADVQPTPSWRASLSDGAIRIPLVLDGPGLERRVIDAPVGQDQLAGLVLRLVDVRAPPHMGHNAGVVAEITGRKSAGDTSGVLVELFGQQGYISAGHKLVRTLRTGRTQLFDLVQDPLESHPLDISKAGPARRRGNRMDHKLDRRVRAVQRSARRRQRRTESQLRTALSSPDPERRRRVARALAHLAREGPLRKATRKALQRARRDKDLEVQQRATLAATRSDLHRGSKVNVTGVAALLTRPDLPDAMRLAAAIVIARSRPSAETSPAAATALAELLGRLSRLDDRRTAIAALGRLPTTSAHAIGALLAASRDEMTTLPAIVALAALRGKTGANTLASAAVPAMESLLARTPDQPVHRAAAITLLRCLGTPAARAALVSRYGREPEAWLRAQTVALLADGTGDAVPQWRIVPVRGCPAERCPVSMVPPPPPPSQSTHIWLLGPASLAKPVLRWGDIELQPRGRYPTIPAAFRSLCLAASRAPARAWSYTLPTSSAPSPGGPTAVSLRADPGIRGTVVAIARGRR